MNQLEPSHAYSEPKLKAYLHKMTGGKSANTAKISIFSLLISAIGSLAGIGFIALLAEQYQVPLLIPSFAASAVLLYAACHVPMAQPRNVIGGHIVSAFVGVVIYQLFGDNWWVVPLAVTLAITLMTLTYTLHPPGGATAFIAASTGQSFDFIISPVGLGALFLVIIAVLVNNLSNQRRYPDYWF